MTPTLVLLPGLDGTGRMLERTRKELARTHPTQVVAYPSDQPMARAELLDYVRAALPTDQPFVLVGESFSGAVAIEIAASRPSELVGLVLVVTFACNPLPASLRWLRLLTGLMRVRPPAWAVRRYMTGPDAADELVEESREVHDIVSPAVLQDRMRQVFDLDVRGLLSAVAVPTLCLTGSRDKLVGEKSRKEFESAIPRLTVIELPQPHLMMHVAGVDVARSIETFVGELAKTAGQLFMVIERFRGGDPRPVYERFSQSGRLLPQDVAYVDSWLDESHTRCFQLMRAKDRSALDCWISNWDDLVEFEVVPVMTSSDAARQFR